MLAGVNQTRTGSGDPALSAAADAAVNAAAAAAAAASPWAPAPGDAAALDMLRATRSSGSGGLLPAGVAARLLPVLLQLAEVRRRQRRFSDAEGLCRRALGVAGMCYPPSHPEVASVKNALAQVRGDSHTWGPVCVCLRAHAAAHRACRAAWRVATRAGAAPLSLH